MSGKKKRLKQRIAELEAENAYLQSGAASVSGRPYIKRLCMGYGSVIGYEETATYLGCLCHKRCA